MKIGFEIVTDMNALMKEIQEEIDQQITFHLAEALERSVELVRNKITKNKAYDDHTGNLRSSTGFIIYKDGKVVHTSFKESPVGTDRVTGLKEGLQAALAELRETEGWGVILISGMEYASWVQSKGFDVLMGAYEDLESVLREGLESIGDII